jgi:fatty acid desaturase
MIADPQLVAALKRIDWRDLVPMQPAEVWRELLLPLPWLVTSLISAVYATYPLALALSFVFFLSGLRVVHGACHGALGLPRAANRIVLFTFSLLMLGSMHVVRWNHLRHHVDCLGPADVEAMGARYSALGAILLGPRFPLRLHRAALTGARGTERCWMLAELAGNFGSIVLLFAFSNPVAIYHLLAMAAGQCLTAFFAVWTVHHHPNPGGLPARTIRHRLRNAITFSMFLHLEHHLFPRVPTAHLPMLARRLDQALPGRKWPVAW